MLTKSVHTCQCGRRWSLQEIKSPMRDTDSAHCTCGLEIISWNGGHRYRVAEIKDQDPK